jgi:hypothetical protein
MHTSIQLREERDKLTFIIEGATMGPSPTRAKADLAVALLEHGTEGRIVTQLVDGKFTLFRNNTCVGQFDFPVDDYIIAHVKAVGEGVEKVMFAGVVKLVDK